MSIWLSLLIAIVGVLMYFAASNPKVQRVGEIMFGCGLLAFLIRVGDAAITALGK